MNKFAVYAITNTVTGYQYIGATTNVLARWSMHRTKLRAGEANKLIQEAWDTYGEAAFSFDVLEYVTEWQNLGAREQHYMDERYERTGNHGYNVKPIGGIGITYTAPPPPTKRERVPAPPRKRISVELSPEVYAMLEEMVDSEESWLLARRGRSWLRNVIIERCIRQMYTTHQLEQSS